MSESLDQAGIEALLQETQHSPNTEVPRSTMTPSPFILPADRPPASLDNMDIFAVKPTDSPLVAAEPETVIPKKKPFRIPWELFCVGPSIVVGIVLGIALTLGTAWLILAKPAPYTPEADNIPPEVPQEHILSGSVSHIQTQFADLSTPYVVSKLTCTGYQPQDNEINPIITLVTDPSNTAGRLLISSSSENAQTELTAIINDWDVKTALIDLPRYDMQKHELPEGAYIFALEKRIGPHIPRKALLITVDSSTEKLLNDSIKGGWHVDYMQNRFNTLDITTKAPEDSLTLVILSHPN